VDEHRGQEDNGRVKVEHSRHSRNEREQGDEERARRKWCVCEPGSKRLEQVVCARNLADQEQAGHEDERRPCLPGRVEYDGKEKHG
jgi:hypothetical protein